jgi:hypothetical protein
MKRRVLCVGLVIVSLVTVRISGAQEPGVITPEDLETAKEAERNTSTNEQYGFAITKPEEWAFPQPSAIITFRPHATTVGGAEYAVELDGLVVTVLRFPADAEWILVNPRIRVDAYQLKTPIPQEVFMNLWLQNFQADPGLDAQVTGPPTTIEVHGRTLAKAGVFMKAPLSVDEPMKDRVDVYAEYYICVVEPQSKVFVIEFMARPADVPLYRKDVDAMIQSIRITKPRGLQEGTKAEL